MKIRLSDEDRARLGCPEWLDVDPGYLSVDDAEALEAAGGDWGLYRESSLAGGRVRTWVALHRAGVTVTPFASLTFNLLGCQFKDVPGKAPSARAGRSTSSTSATSSRPSPRKRSAN